MTTSSTTLQTGLKLHREGAFGQAERLYNDVLRIDPTHSDALHLLGMLAHQQNDNAKAVDFISKAIAVNAEAPQYHSNLGVSYRNLGQTEQAINCFREAIRIEPTFAGAYYNLGMSLEGIGKREQARDCYLEAIRLKPDFDIAHNNLGKLHFSEGHYADAVDCYLKALEISSDSSDVYYNLGNVFTRMENLDQAVENFREAICRNSDVAEYHNNLGAVLKRREEYDEAATCFERALELNPDYEDARSNLGALQLGSGRLEQSIDSFQRAIEINPDNHEIRGRLASALCHHGRYEEAAEIIHEGLRRDASHAELHFGLGHIHQSDGKHIDARGCYEEATRLNPDYQSAWANLGAILIGEDCLDEAENAFRNVLRLNPSDAIAHYNLGNVYKDQWRLDEAIACYQRALELNPGFYEPHVNLGQVFQKQGRLPEAIASLAQGIQLHPDDAEAHFHYALALLLSGDFKSGWDEYEWRWQYEAQNRDFSFPVWNGKSLHAETLLVYAEQGVGDEIMFAACLPELTRKTGSCLLECDPRLVSLFSRSFPLARVIARPVELDGSSQHELASVDKQIALGSVGRYLRKDLESFPESCRFLVADPELRNKWRQRLSRLGDGLKVGISWRGGNAPKIRKQRSTMLDLWSEILAVPGVQFVNVQYGDCEEELRVIRELTGIEIHDWDDADPLHDMENFAAQIAELDLVISVDNSTVHMAGALGVDAWTLLPFAPNWRWLLNRDDSPWYTSVKLYRQENIGEWKGVMRTLASDLHTRSESSGITEEKQTLGSEDAAREQQKYEEIWTHDSYRVLSPGLDDADKVQLVMKLKESGVKTILDAGCGSGKLMQKLITEYPNEFDVHGFDISRNCLDPFFDDLKDEILSIGCLWNPDDMPGEYDAVICTDVLEHIPTEHVPAVLSNLKQCTKKTCYLAIALFPDGFGPKLLGQPLHLTVEEPQWWYSRIAMAGFRIQNYAVEKHSSGQNLWLHVFATV